MDGTSQAERRWLPVLLALAAAALFFLLHPYRGIVHDGHLYTLQALNRLFPQLYGNDVFLRFGSQDNYTLFSSLHAGIISWMGVESAAAAITLASLLFFLASAFLLARTLATPLQAWFALILLLAIPAYYGPDHVFHYLEEFVTPRQLAGALVVGSLWAWLSGLRAAGAALAAGAVVLHPIIALPGVLLLATIDWLIPLWRRLWPLAILGALVALASVAGLIPVSRWQFDPEWHELASSRAYLSLTNWNLDAWSRVVTVATTLIVAASVLESRQRQVSLATLAVCGALLVLAFVGGDLLRLVIVVQAQPWRALWLATVVAIILLPPACVALWRQGALHRCALLLLAASWASPAAGSGLGLAGLTLLATWGAARQRQDAHQRLMLGGAWLVVATVMIFSLANAWLALNSGLTRVASLPPTLDRIATASLGGVMPLLVLFAGRGLISLQSRATPAALAAGMAILCVFLGLASGRTWASFEYPQPVRDAFADWRKLIPEGSDVLWLPDDDDVGRRAFQTWLLLERPSFLSRTQASNALFSREAAIEMNRRDQTLHGILPVRPLFEKETPTVTRPLRLEQVCRHSAVRYLVSAEPFVDASGIALPAAAGPDFTAYRLYICT